MSPAARIGCLAWGSLVWDPRTLPCAGSFRSDGPWLPIEFARVSVDGRVTLVIDPEAPRLQTFWVPLAVEDLGEAVRALAIREKIEPAREEEWVGRRILGESPSAEPVFSGIEDWLVDRSLDAVVWTALPSRRPDGSLGRPSFESLLAHLQSLSGEGLERAEQYIRRTPRPVKTPNRARFEALLGWLPTDA